MSADEADGRMRIVCGGRRMVIRPLGVRDVDMERRFVDQFSLTSGCFRFLELMRAPGMAPLRTLTAFDPGTDVGFLATTVVGSREDPIGVARFHAGADRPDCRFAVSVADRWRNKGLGTLLMQRLIEAARARGIEAMHSSAACDNDVMNRFALHLKLRHRRDPDDDRQILYSIDLKERQFPNRFGLARENLQ
jgi:GNAT superfamily N-acetyltransferase